MLLTCLYPLFLFAQTEDKDFRPSEKIINQQFVNEIIVNKTDTIFTSTMKRLADTVILLKCPKISSLKINFYQPDFNHPRQFQTRLGGLETIFNEWNTISYRYYYNLEPGFYNFMLNVKFSGNEEIFHLSIPIHIKQPFYQSQLFFALLLVANVLIILSLVFYSRWINASKKVIESKLELEKMNAIDQLRKDFQKQLNEKITEISQQRVIAKELKSKRYKMVTVLFSNIIGFTKLTEHPYRDQLVDDLDKFFYNFDQVVKKFNIQKIKTIGDTYICAGGIPEKNRTNPIEVVLAAFEMQKYMESLKQKYIDKDQTIWEIRMGIHTGPVFANIENKRAIELWGDTVNIASRIESSGDFSRVNITGMTYELVREFFICQFKGKIPVKYQGEIDMYFIEGFRPKLSNAGIGIIPNEYFWVKLGMIRFDDLEEMVMDEMEKKLPKKLYYHNLKHTIDVIVQVELISKNEDINEEELLLLKTAALFHDTGFMLGYSDHEELSAQYAAEVLPKWNYTPRQIDVIRKLILVTKLPPRPANLLENIICDADLDYLGRADFIPVSANLFKELVENKMIENDMNKWNEMQIRFIESHQYFTETAKRLRDVNKLKQLESIRNMVDNK